MQKNTKFTLKNLSTRIFPLACFILALVISPIVFMHTENMPVPAVQGDAVSADLNDTQNTDAEKSEDNAQTGVPISADSQTSADDQAPTDEAIQQSDVETVEPPLSESYMLRELFSDIDFTAPTASTKPEAPAQQNPDASQKPELPVTVTPPPTTVAPPAQQNPPEDKTPVTAPETPTPETSTPAVTPETETQPEVQDAPVQTQPGNVTVTVPVIESESNENESETVDADATAISPPLHSGSTTRGSITNVRVLDHQTGGVLVMDLDEYIASVIVAEMPSYAGAEALKAQAVACRTFVIHRAVVSATHSGAQVCTNPGHCQAFMSKARFKAKYGEAGTEFYNRAFDAAKSTSGIIAVYDGTPITAAFHASSGGSTMSSADVWGGILPYLVPVYSPEQDDPEMRELISAHKSFSKEVFIRYLAAAGYSGASAYYDKGFESFVGPITHTNSGKVGSVSIAGENISGQTMKNVFGLRSTCFSISYNENNITFVCLGYGHGVGMSQLGACTMAKQGSSYADILTHYYTGVDLVVW